MNENIVIADFSSRRHVGRVEIYRKKLFFKYFNCLNEVIEIINDCDIANPNLALNQICAPDLRLAQHLISLDLHAYLDKNQLQPAIIKFNFSTLIQISKNTESLLLDLDKIKDDLLSEILQIGFQIPKSSKFSNPEQLTTYIDEKFRNAENLLKKLSLSFRV